MTNSATTCDFVKLLDTWQHDPLLLTPEEWNTLEAHLLTDPPCSVCFDRIHENERRVDFSNQIAEQLRVIPSPIARVGQPRKWAAKTAAGKTSASHDVAPSRYKLTDQQGRDVALLTNRAGRVYVELPDDLVDAPPAGVAMGETIYVLKQITDRIAEIVELGEGDLSDFSNHIDHIEGQWQW